MTRTERQQEAVKRWLAHKGKGTIVGATGFGFLKKINII